MDTYSIISSVSEKLATKQVPVSEVQQIQAQISLAHSSVESIQNILTNLQNTYSIDIDDELQLIKLMDVQEIDSRKIDASVVKDIHVQAAVSAFNGRERSVVKFNAPLTLPQVRRLGRAVFDFYQPNKTVMPVFVTPSVELEGQITSSISPHPKDITLVQTAKEKAGDDEVPAIRFPIFGEQQFSKRKSGVKTYEVPFYIYRFESKDRRQYVLFSKEKLVPGFFKVTGIVAPLKDETKLGEKAVVGNNIDIIIPYSIESNVHKITEKEFKEITKEWTEESFMQQLFGKCRHPRNFERLIAAWWLSGSFQFNLHLGIIAKAGTGKTSLLESLDINADEIEGIFDGSQGTLKGLVPSYYQTAKEGYYPKCRRIALIDEFFTTLTRSSGGRKPEDSDETGLLTSLLEQKQRTGASAKGSLEVNPTAKALFATNPKYGLKTLPECAEKLNRAFLSRILWYVQTDNHINYIDERKPHVQSILNPHPEHNPEFLSVFDYTSAISLKVDSKAVRKIFDDWAEHVPENLVEVYDARSHHHIYCLVDGIAKLNSILEKRGELCVKASDYEEASDLFGMCVTSWGVDKVQLAKLPPRVRVEFLKLHAHKVYNLIDREPGLSGKQINQLIGTDVSRTLDHIVELEVVIREKRDDGSEVYYPFWHFKNKKGDEDVD